jgi:hypothetical protein
VDLYAGATPQTDNASLAADAYVGQSVFSKVRIGSGKSRVVTLKFNYPTSVADGAYFLVASVSELGLDVAPTVTSAPTAVEIAAPKVDLAATFAAAQPVLVRDGRTTSVVLTVENVGNVAAIGTLGVHLYALSNGALDASADPLLATIAGRVLHLAPGRSTRLRLSFVASPSLAPGTYSLVAAIDTATQPADANAANDTAMIVTRA